MLDRDASPIRILFNCWANRDTYTSQSLTAKEIASRLDPQRFTASLFLSRHKEPDPRLIGRPNIHLVRLPNRMGRVVVARELLWGAHDIVFYSSLNGWAGRLFQNLRRLAGPRRCIECVETSLEQIDALPESVQRYRYDSLRRADFRSAITPAIRRDLQDRLALGSTVIPLGVDLELFRPVERKTHRPPWRVLYVASIQARKQTHLILELARRLQGEPVEFHCIGPTLGDPSYAHRLLAETERDDLPISFLGALSQQEIYAQMMDADIYLLPSRLEGFGKTTLEAAAAGLPAIVFADYETTAVVDQVTGYQVATLDEMEEALRRLVDNSDLRLELGHAASEHARSFSWDATARHWESTFLELMDQKVLAN